MRSWLAKHDDRIALLVIVVMLVAAGITLYSRHNDRKIVRNEHITVDGTWWSTPSDLFPWSDPMVDAVGHPAAMEVSPELLKGQPLKKVFRDGQIYRVRIAGTGRNAIILKALNPPKSS